MNPNKNKIISTLECPNLTSFRRNGNTTRQVDFAIQKLFEGYTVKIEDHSLVGVRMNVRLQELIMKRLELEHMFKKENCITDRGKSLMKIINNE